MGGSKSKGEKYNKLSNSFTKIDENILKFCKIDPSGTLSKI